MEEVKIRELPEKPSISGSDYVVIEDQDGTKRVLVKNFRSLVLTSLYFKSIDDLKNSTDRGLKEGDICETLGYYTPGDGGGARYRITYNPGAVEDGKFVHYLSYSDTLRAEIILEDTIHVNQFGAKGDGNHDDTSAIQAALDNSDTRTVLFRKGRKYLTRDIIKVNYSNTVINGNGATLFPHYVNGIIVNPDDDTVSDITIDDLNFDCSAATSAVKVNKASSVSINNCIVSGISNKGIHVTDSSHVYIKLCRLTGSTYSTGVLLDGDSCSNVTIKTCRFDTFAKGISIDNTGLNLKSTVRIDNNIYDSSVNNSVCVHVSNDVNSIIMNSNIVENANTFLYSGGAGKISCNGLISNTSKVFDILNANCSLHLNGLLTVGTNSVLFPRMAGKLHSDIMWNQLPNGASFSNIPTGELFDSIMPYGYNETGYSMSGNKLTLREARNMYVDWTISTGNLNAIDNGIKGQLLYIKSSTNKSIIAVANKIVLSESSIVLGPYKGILLKYDGSKWIQISY